MTEAQKDLLKFLIDPGEKEKIEIEDWEIFDLENRGLIQIEDGGKVQIKFIGGEKH